MTADRPATEPRTHGPNDGCGDLLWEHMSAVPGFDEEVRQGRADIAAGRYRPWSEVKREAEAAQGAAPLDQCNCACMECGGLDGIHCLQCASEGAAPLDCKELGEAYVECQRLLIESRSEGAAPRAEGLPYCQLCGADPVSEDHALETQRRWKALTSGAAPRAEGLDEERLTRILTAIHGDNVPFPRGVPTSPREYAEQIVAMDTRLSRPSDERVPESEEPRA